MKHVSLAAVLLIFPLMTSAQLAVSVSPPKIAGNKAVVHLEFKNTFAETIESARAVVFLLNQDGKMVGNATRWIIGVRGYANGLPPGATNVFNFVVATDGHFSGTNLQAKVSFNRVVLEGGKLADVAKQVTIKLASK
jgi:hypothetical protein